MDDRRFDALAKRVGTSRRSLLKKMVGLGGTAAVARLSVGEAEAARRGYGGPPTGQAPLKSSRICTLGNPTCCMECELFPWVSASTVQQRLASCIYDEHKSCPTCVSAAVAPYEGACQWQ